MGGVDERAQVVRLAVGAGGRVEHHAVVTPVPAAGKIRQRHELDGRDAEFLQVVELVDGGEERAFRRERADMQFVDHQIVSARPAVGCRRAATRTRRRHDLRRTVDTLGLEARERVGERFAFVAVEPEFVEVARAARRVVAWKIPPSPAGERHRAHRLSVCGKNDGLDATRFRSPDAKADASGAGARAMSRSDQRVEIAAGSQISAVETERKNSANLRRSADKATYAPYRVVTELSSPSTSRSRHSERSNSLSACPAWYVRTGSTNPVSSHVSTSSPQRTSTRPGRTNFCGRGAR